MPRRFLPSRGDLNFAIPIEQVRITVDPAVHTREHLVSLESEQELQRFDALYTRAAEKSMNETGDSLIHDAALGAAGLTLLAAGAMAGASGLGGGVSLLAQALGVKEGDE